MFNMTTPRPPLETQLKFEPFDSFAVPPYAHYLTDATFAQDVLGDSVNPPVADFLPDVLQQEATNFVLPDEYTAAEAYRDLVLATRCVIQGYPLSAASTTEAAANSVGNFWFRASFLLAKAQDAVWWTPDHMAKYVELYQKLPKLLSPTFYVKIILYLQANFADVVALTHPSNEDALCEFAFDVGQARVTEPPQIETFSAADARKTAVEAVYYYARSGELYETDIKAALEVLLQCAFPAR